ncbi:IPT/TIG domain-containing protein [Xylophilus sp. GOD-11R]|uniref:IPT/TIG domain-containing protein n=1 Tax=Xylophilus sp. GOD-11R TaxID=3089814 RepID=UPI00298C79E7|nr:IPT/TIG domain-containing protein [Xylophilus sp. GOD-11R]WPB57672.1 IPT/TIG domain-containing protein [Xylophilus sp. GOD-11R]
MDHWITRVIVGPTLSAAGSAAIVFGFAAPAYAIIDPVSGYLDQAERGVRASIQEAGSQGKGVVMETGQATLAAIALFRQQYSAALDESVTQLSGARHQLFQDIQASASTLSGAANKATGDIQRSADTLAATVQSLPLTKDIPRITKISPIYSVQSGAPTEFSIQGLALDNHQPILTFAEKQARPSTQSFNELRFMVPEHAAAITAPVFVQTNLQLYERKTKWLFFDDFIARDFPIQLIVYPETIGVGRITPIVQAMTVEKTPRRTPDKRCESQHGEGTRTEPLSATATPGWEIDVNTISFNTAYSNNGSITTNSSATTGFTGVLTCTGFGRIEKWGVVVDRGQQGVISGYYSYTETRQVASTVRGTSVELPVKWGASRIDNWPADTVTVIFELTPTFAVPLDSIEGSGESLFAVMAYNPQAKTTRITIKNAEQVLRAP